MKSFAQMSNEWSKRLKGMEGMMKPFNDAINLLPGGQLLNVALGKDSYLTPWSNAKRAKEAGRDLPSAGRPGPMMANTQALMENTQAMARLNGTIGGGQMSREAIPSALRGQQLHEALVTRSLRLGALG